MLPAQRALLSVSDKTGLGELARGLAALQIEIVSTGGTKRFLEEQGVAVRSVAEITGYPEILDGRVKTLHPAIHGGILADRVRASHLAQLAQHEIQPIDLVVVNLYPFEQTATREEASFAEVVEMIDIGGPCMLRAAAKNHSGVVVVVDPADYPQVLAMLAEQGKTIPEALRRRLALKAFRHTQTYDAAIANWLERQDGAREILGGRLHLNLFADIEPRYGENPHQRSVVYRWADGPGLFGGFRQLQGKELSYNNLLDADAARRVAGSFDQPAVAIVKHNNPCGVGLGKDLVEAYQRALECDPVSAFGSVVAVNREVGVDFAEATAELFVEVLLAPNLSEEARVLFERKKNLRVLECPRFAPSNDEVEYRSIAGGLLAQIADAAPHDDREWRVVTKKKPSAEQLGALDLAWRVCRYVKSNAIVLANRKQTVGIGAGQMSRVDSCRLALSKAQLTLNRTVAASDAFFPFRDGLDVLVEGGVRAVVQPGGSKRDDEVIAAANEHKIAMIFTGERHFRH